VHDQLATRAGRPVSADHRCRRHATAAHRLVDTLSLGDTDGDGVVGYAMALAVGKAGHHDRVVPT